MKTKSLRTFVDPESPSTALMKPLEACDFLNLCLNTLRKYTAPKGPIPCVRIGTHVRYSRTQLEEYIESAKVTAAK